MGACTGLYKPVQALKVESPPEKQAMLDFLGLSTVPVYGYDRTFYGRQPYRENFSPVRVWVSTVPVPYHYHTSVYGQLIRPLCHKLWVKPVVMHQNCKGKHLETEINDICARIH